MSPLVFTLVMDELKKDIQDEFRDVHPSRMLFANYIVFIDKSKDRIKNKLETWRNSLEPKGF